MSIKPGVYRITNLASQSTVRSYKLGETLFVSSTKEDAGPFELFSITLAEAGYHIKSIALDAFVSALPVEKGAKVTAERTYEVKEIFEISKEDAESYVIKIADKDLLWTVQPPIIPRGDILLEPANGEKIQQFTFKNVTEL